VGTTGIGGAWRIGGRSRDRQGRLEFILDSKKTLDRMGILGNNFWQLAHLVPLLVAGGTKQVVGTGTPS